MQDKVKAGFSKLSKKDKLKWVAQQFADSPESAERDFTNFRLSDESLQRVFDGFSENTISNFILPYGVAPNLLINGRLYTVPMVIEESSVVAAASSAAKYWLDRGGFHTTILSTQKVGQVHFSWAGDHQLMMSVVDELREYLLRDVVHLTANMEKRGGGVTGISLLDYTHLEADYYQLRVTFETCDSMGANFINSVLEEFGNGLERFVAEHPAFEGGSREVDIVMAILSNYTPECLVRAWVECPVSDLSEGQFEKETPLFAEKFAKAVRIAHIDPYRAVTHNKGIFNGIDAVVLATANDFRAIEACGHAYAARDGQYRSLSYCTIENGIFRFWLDIPLAVGTVGGLTRLHPLAARSLEMLGNPSATELMGIIAVTGLAQNFAALRSLVTTGIQQGHMKMHLTNILNHLGAAEAEMEAAFLNFSDKVITFTAVRDFIETLRKTPAADNVY